jgi:hypothetical protein
MANGENSVELELRLTLPDSLAREAEAKGLLTPQALESLLRAELQRGRVNQLFQAAERLATLPPLTEAEVEAEIQAVRAEKRAARARRS